MIYKTTDGTEHTLLQLNHRIKDIQTSLLTEGDEAMKCLERIKAAKNACDNIKVTYAETKEILEDINDPALNAHVEGLWGVAAAFSQALELVYDVELNL